MEDVEPAFLGFHRAQAEHHHQATTARDFYRAIKELDGTFIASTQAKRHPRDETNRIILQLQNPSLRDYLRAYLDKHPTEVAALFATAAFFEQIQILWPLDDGQAASTAALCSART